VAFYYAFEDRKLEHKYCILDREDTDLVSKVFNHVE